MKSVSDDGKIWNENLPDDDGKEVSEQGSILNAFLSSVFLIIEYIVADVQYKVLSSTNCLFKTTFIPALSVFADGYASPSL